MSINILVTGANGQLGKTLKDESSNLKGEYCFTFVSKAELDITNPKQIEVFLEEKEYDYCINCAAYTKVEQAEDSAKTAFKVNAEAVKYLGTIFKKTNTVLIHISTDYVFDGSKNSPYLETDDVNPINVYGKSKFLGEQHVQDILDNYFIIRASWLYSKYGHNFLKTIISKIKQNERLNVISSQTGTPTSCIDLSKFIFQLITTRNTSYGIYNFSANGETTWYDFALFIAKHFPEYNTSKIVPLNEFNTKAQRPSYSVLDNSKSQQILSNQSFWQKSADDVIADILNN
ncbi:dTDP-4-dehydrorhamnose reductase [Yeosuana sp. MJ-SS3]|jgi:dTDP-4-dehydrorhamnose reductase|uniref:dTDP-4-dehydrorhamnose reductase n=1 Tax=Gilvirhabdus luticola TaxID=3079858 RepID=A0ABU3U2T3_9FLAO|nr:dTDP-4-dehydrorhamnose reductase [Yeosuana sp. MJ-SS3]MDU8884661.1 dTDP-4-dehydrorhamnose reductase [Yeosuana sp. MJ-SS3]